MKAGDEIRIIGPATSPFLGEQGFVERVGPTGALRWRPHLWGGRALWIDPKHAEPVALPEQGDDAAVSRRSGDPRSEMSDDLLAMAVSYLNQWFGDESAPGLWGEHDAEAIALVELFRPASPPARDDLAGEERKNVEMHHTLALIHGFNEMATKATTLGEKVYYRMARDASEKRFNALGGQINRTEEHTPVLVIPGHVPEIRFDARDIELMRACVARHDAATPDQGGDSRPDGTEEGKTR